MGHVMEHRSVCCGQSMGFCMLYVVWCGVRREEKRMHIVVEEVSVHQGIRALRELYVLYY